MDTPFSDSLLLRTLHCYYNQMKAVNVLCCVSTRILNLQLPCLNKLNYTLVARPIDRK